MQIGLMAAAYAGVLAAVLDLAGEPAERVALPEEPGLDESWQEPAAFGGCSGAGQCVVEEEFAHARE